MNDINYENEIGKKILEKFFQQNDIKCRKIISVKGSILSKLINLIYLLDYSTIYKAVLDDIDPSPIKSIDFIKSEIENNYKNYID